MEERSQGVHGQEKRKTFWIGKKLLTFRRGRSEGYTEDGIQGLSWKEVNKQGKVSLDKLILSKDRFSSSICTNFDVNSAIPCVDRCDFSSFLHFNSQCLDLACLLR